MTDRLRRGPFRTATVWGLRLGLAIASALVTALLAELVLQRYRAPMHGDADRLVATYYTRHPELRWLPQKNLHGRHRKPGSFDTTFTTNSRGLRSPEHALGKRTAGPRIVTLGDSFTWGYGVQDDEAYPRVLEKLLPGTEVVNLGVAAYNTRQELDYFKLEGVLYQPDSVILGFCLNDIVSAGTVRSRGAATAAGSAPRQEPTVQGFKEWLSDRSALYGLGRDAAHSNRALTRLLVRAGALEPLAGFDGLDPNLMPALRTFPAALQRAYDDTERTLVELKTFLDERQIRFVLVLIPSLQSIDRPAFARSLWYSELEPAEFDVERPYHLLEEFARRHGIEVVNPYARLKRQFESGTPLYLAQDAHLNAAGQRAIAETIADYLAAQITKPEGFP